MDLAACVDGCMIVQYGHAKPEDNRLNALFQLLPDYAKLPSFRSFEPMGTLLPHIFSRDPEDEFDPKAKVYVPDWALTYIVRRLNKVYSDDLTSFEEYEPAWDWNVWGGWSESGLTGK